MAQQGVICALDLNKSNAPKLFTFLFYPTIRGRLMFTELFILEEEEVGPEMFNVVRHHHIGFYSDADMLSEAIQKAKVLVYETKARRQATIRMKVKTRPVVQTTRVSQDIALGYATYVPV